MHLPPLNYHHLRYFWTVARTGSVTAAARELHLTQPAVSAQIRALEQSLGHPLFVRSGRHLSLTDVGQLALRYAEEIFQTGRELQETLRGRPGSPVRFSVGVTDSMPKLVTQRLLAPALALPEPVRLVLREGRVESLLADLATHALDLVLSDAPAPSSVKVRVFSHLLGDSHISLFGQADLVARLRRRFPRSLDGAPFLMPTSGTVVRRQLEQWFDTVGIKPQVVAEIEDSALLKVFGAEGSGIFAAPTAVEADVRRQYHVGVLGRIESIREHFYALSVERRISHPAVLAVTRVARRDLFAHAP